MAASLTRKRGARPQLGAPLLPVNAPARYLRHRASADRAYRNRRRQLWWHRGALAFVVGCFYLVIGRDLLAVARAKKDSAVMEIRCETHQLATDIKRAADAAKLASDQTVLPLDVSSAPTIAEQTSMDDAEAILSNPPVQPRSRLHPVR